MEIEQLWVPPFRCPHCGYVHEGWEYGSLACVNCGRNMFAGRYGIKDFSKIPVQQFGQHESGHFHFDAYDIEEEIIQILLDWSEERNGGIE